MRMWMVDPRIMCRQHLLGEHVELHMFAGHIKRKKKVDKYIENNCLELKSMHKRHIILVEEMINRGYNHNSPYINPDITYLPLGQQNHIINYEESLKDLLNRCRRCREIYEKLKNGELNDTGS